MRYKDPKPEIIRIEELVAGVKVGDIKLPKFQRPFVWKKEDILKLWDSIYKGYPIGSILLWLTHQKLASERKIGDLDISEREDEYPTNYLLDGQQRLSSLCGALYWNSNDAKSIWNIVFDVEKEDFLYPEEELISYFPLNKLINTSDFIQQCKRFEAHSSKEKYIKNAERLLQAIKDYKIAAVKIGDMNLNEVAPIFERINSSGRQLTMVDLMRAATWKGGFDLNDAIETIRSACESKNFSEIEDTHILRNISACAGLGIHKEAIEKLRDCTSSDLQSAAEKCVSAYELAVDFITTELPLPSINYLPYALQLTYLVEFFNLCPTPSVNKRDLLKKWFWKTSLTQHYGSANTGLITKDLADIRKFANDKDIEPLTIGKKINFKGFLYDSFVLNKASSLTFALLLANKKPKSLIDGSSIDTFRSLSYKNKLEYHHIFPKAFLKSSGKSNDDINSHLNICMLNLSNNREISDSEPAKYFKKIASNAGSMLNEVLKSNYLSNECFNAGLKNDYKTFLEERYKILFDEIKLLVDDEVI